MKIDTRYETERLVSKDATRPHLHNLHYDKGNQKLVATNGHAMAVVPVVPSDDDVAGWVTPDAMRAARKAAGKMSSGEIHANGALAVKDGPTFPRPGALGVGFPPYEAVIPGYRQGDAGTVTVGIDAALLLELAKTLGAHKTTQGCALVHLTIKLPDVTYRPDIIPVREETEHLVLGEMLDPMVVSVGNDPAVGIIMPVRI